jgi:hypothetical protein
VEFVGCDKAVYSAIKAVGARYMRAAQGRAWLVEQASADEVMALLEYRRYRLVMTL